MRTTLVIDDRLLGAAQREAARRGVTLSELIDAALRGALDATPKQAASRFEMLTFGGDAVVEHEPNDFAEALAAEDADRVGR